MKTKLSKRLLSVLLAIMMIVTSLPFVAISAFAADDTENLEASMEAFDVKISEMGADFTNLVAAYNAYVNAQKALDAYNYGGASNKVLTDAQNALDNAIGDVNRFMGYPAKYVEQVFANDSAAAEHAAKHTGILWTETGVNSARGSASGDTWDSYIYYPETTFMYDGKTTLSTTMILDANGNKNANKNRWILSAFATDSSGNISGDFSFNNALWRGEPSNFDANWATGYGTNKYLSSSTDGYNGGDGHQMRKSGVTNLTASSKNNRFANIWTFIGTMDNSENLRTFYPAVSVYVNNENKWNTTADQNRTINGTTAIRVVNVKRLLDTLTATQNKLAGIDLDDYAEGGLLQYFQILDSATTFSPTSFFASSNDYNSCVTAITNLINSLNNAPTDQKDSDAYENLRNAIDHKRSAYGNGENNGYTDESWGKFVEAWNNAKNFMAAVQEQGYTAPEDAQKLADILNGIQLVTSVEKADTTALETVIDRFYRYADIFTDATYAAAEKVINDAKIAVWGSVEAYKDAASGLDDTPENQQTILDQIANVEAAIRGLRIDPDAFVTTPYGRYSLNSAIALKDGVGDPKDYANYVVFDTAIGAANDYLLTLPVDDLTDYNNQYEAYIDMVSRIVEAYYDLEYAFTRIPNGSYASEPVYTSITQLEFLPDASDRYRMHADFTYPKSGVVFRTNHDAFTAKYGDADFTYYVNNGKDSNKEKNAVDGITINGTEDAVGKLSGTESSGAIGANPNPKAMSDSQKIAYAAGLSYNGFSLSNFRVTGENSFDTKWGYGVTAAGETIWDRQPAGDQLTQILGTVEGAGALEGSSRVRPSKDGSNASLTFTADMSYDVPSKATYELSSATVPEANTYTMSGRYFGVTYIYATQPGAQTYCGYGYMTSKSNNEPLYSTLTVVDITYLIKLCDMIEDTVVPNSQMYTDGTWKTLSDALVKAESNMEYMDMTAANILQECSDRYRNLWNAYVGLKIKEFDITFTYNTSPSRTTSQIIKVQYGETLSQYAEQIAAIIPPEFTSTDGVTLYTFTGWTPEIDYSAAVTREATYKAVYDTSLNTANFDEFNKAKADLIAMLNDYIYLAEHLKTVQEMIESMTYFDYTLEQQSEIMGEEQSAINAETDILLEIIEQLPSYEFDETAAEAAKAKAKAEMDSDVYDLAAIDFDYYETVNVAGKDVIGLLYTQEEIDDAVREVLNSASKLVYTIYLNNEEVGKAEYGTSVIVDSDGTFVIDVDDTTVDNPDCDLVAWSYSYAAPSRNNVQTAPKYMVTSNSLGFIVKGDTYLDTTPATAADEGYVVTFKTDDGKVFDVEYTVDGQVTMPDAPNYAFYKFAGYDNDKNAGDVITVTANTIITANYTALKDEEMYTISFFDGRDAWDDADPTSEGQYYYNELVKLSSSNAYVWATALYDEDTYGTTYVIVAYGTEYSFYACQSLANDEYMGLVALSEDEFNDITEPGGDTIYDGAGNELVAEQDTKTGAYIYPEAPATVSVLENVVPIYDDDGKFEKFSMIGTFTLPEGYTMIETGFLFSSQDDADLTVENVGVKGVARMKASRYTCGNQFVVNIKAPSNGATVNFKYAGYAIVQDAEGNLVTLYSKPVPGSTAGF